MLTQEEFMDLQALRPQGLTITEIATELGYHPATVRRWLAAGGPPAKRRAQAPPLIDEHWATRIAELVRRSPRLLAASVFEIVVTEGFEGSYPTVARACCARSQLGSRSTTSRPRRPLECGPAASPPSSASRAWSKPISCVVWWQALSLMAEVRAVLLGRSTTFTT